MSRLNDTLKSVVPVDATLRPAIQAHLDDLTKPQGSLGKLELFAMQYCLAAGTDRPVFGKKHIFCFAGDHGVADEGVSAFPKAVTPQMVRNILGGGAAISALCRHGGIGLTVVDMGVDDPLENAPGLCRRKIARGTANIARGPAMTVEQAEHALEAGIDLALEAAGKGVTLLGTGDMGIANTTPSAALFCALLSLEPEIVAGRGTGVSDEGLRRKIGVIARALEVNRSRLTDPLAVLAALGGFEIAGICGLILGGAASRIPVVVDGFISSAAALVACRLCPSARDYLFFSHLSQEKGHTVFLDQFGATPILSLDMRLGEGTGAALAMSIVEASIRVYNEMATFSSAGVATKEK